VQNTAGCRADSPAAVNTPGRPPGRLGALATLIFFELLLPIRDDERCQLWRRACNGSTSALGTQGPHGCGGNMPARELSTYRCMEVTMNFFDSTSAIMALIMAGVFAPITMIHFLATSVFH
jgi:hypothetical protein